ncbi:Tenascin-X [Halotydeus destructor]|nr:Tenascin-X [Halotydeus destructor]
MCLNSVCGDIRCLDDCNDNGKCVSGVCQCHQGYSGPSCVADYCRNNCNGRGQCNAKGKCQCFLDYGGEDCSRTGAGHPVYEDYVENLEDSSFGNLFLVIMCLIVTIVAGALLFVYYQKHRYTTCFLMRLRVESISDQCRSQLGKMMKR